MNCPICEYRRIARQALSLVTSALAHCEMDPDGWRRACELDQQRLKLQFCEVYRAEQEASSTGKEVVLSPEEMEQVNRIIQDTIDQDNGSPPRLCEKVAYGLGER